MTTYFRPPFFLLFFLLSISGFAQHSVEGKVVDVNQNPISFANVILLSAEDSTTVHRGAVSAEDGRFLLEDVEKNDYLLRLSFIGYEDLLRKISVSKNEDLGELSMTESVSNLGEVSITGKRPVISRSIDRITFNVENSTLSTGNSFELLKRTPGVIVSQGQLLVKNRAATVYINDRKVYLSARELQQLLEGFSAENVQLVEVITNPPAKYDAEGGAILNIKTSKFISIGYKGSVNANASYGERPKYGAGTSHYYKNNRINLFTSYNFNYRDDLKDDESEIVFYEPSGSVAEQWLGNFEKNTESVANSFNAILDINLSEKSTLNFSGNLLLMPSSTARLDGRINIFDPEAQMESFFTTDSRRDNDQQNVLLSAAYDRSFGDNGAKLSAVVNYIHYQDEETQTIRTDYFLADGIFDENSFFTDAGQSSDIYTAKIDLSLPSEAISFETGAKYSGVQSESGLDFYDRTSAFVEGLSDTFDYTEDIYAAYISASRSWENWSVKAGLRGEYTDIEGFSGAVGLINDQQYFELFPTFYVLNTINENHSIGLDYSRRIIRPRFQSLNPYRTYINENDVIVGNPDLQPGFANKINFNYTYKNKLSFDLYWDKIDDATAVLPFQDNEEKIMRTVNSNLNFQQQYSLDVTFYDYVKNWWYLYLYSSFFYMEQEFVALESGNEVVTNDVYSTYLMAQNFFTLSKDGTFSGELIGTYLPKYIAGSYDFEEPQYAISVGIRKSFMDNRLITTLNVDDILDTQNIPLRSRYLNQNNSFFAQPESRMIRLGIIYKFGNFKLTDNQKTIDAEESERLKEKTVL